MRRILPMMSLALAAAMLAGCRGDAAALAAEVEWGPEKDGIATRLVPLEKEYVLGRPMRFRLEMTNRTSTEMLYDHQQVAVNHSLIITGPDGKRAPYIRGTCQTSMRGSLATAPGEVVVLFDGLDANEQYFIGRPGRWTFQYGGSGLSVGEPKDWEMFLGLEDRAADAEARKASWLRLMRTEYPSNVVQIEVLPGELPPWRDAMARVLPILPSSWEAYTLRSEDPATVTDLGLRHRVGKSGPGIGIAETTTLADPTVEGPVQDAEHWGRNERGHVYVQMPPLAEYKWPQAREKIAAALDVSDTAPPTPDEVTRVIQLRAALHARDAERVAAVLNTRPDIVNADLYSRRVKDELFDGWVGGTPLHWAVQLGDVALARLLLDRGADIEARYSWYHSTPLHYAARAGRKELAALLLDRGAEVDAKDRGGKTPLYEAAQKGHGDAVALLLDRGADANGRVEKTGNWTPLHTAASAGHLGTVKVLLAHGADANAKSRDGKTPPQLAEEKGHAEIAEMLRRHGEE